MKWFKMWSNLTYFEKTLLAYETLEGRLLSFMICFIMVLKLRVGREVFFTNVAIIGFDTFMNWFKMWSNMIFLEKPFLTYETLKWRFLSFMKCLIMILKLRRRDQLVKITASPHWVIDPFLNVLRKDAQNVLYRADESLFQETYDLICCNFS